MSVKQQESRQHGLSVVKAPPEISFAAQVHMILCQHKSNKTCSLTDEELVLLALANSPDKWLKATHIGEFIMTKVKYYSKHSAKYFFGATTSHLSAHNVLSLAARTQDYLSTYGIPVHIQLNEQNQKLYMMTSGAAYAFIQQSFGKREDLKPFQSVPIESTHSSTVTDPASCPLMKIPLELRLKIYRLVVKVTGFRLRVGRGTLLAYDEKVPFWGTKSQNVLTMPRMSKMLTLLSVNKQIHHEAMPEFYKRNCFEFLDMSCLKSFLTNIGPERRKFMRDVSIRYLNISTAAAGAKLLTQSDTLQKLTLIMSVSQDPADGHFTIDSSRRKFASLSQIPGFTALKRLRGIKQLTFNPDLEHKVVDAFLRPTITQPKVVKVKKTEKSNKRKLKELEADHETHQPSSKKAKVN